MALGMETFGNYNIRKLPNGMYSVSLNNGNMGAFMTDEAGLAKFKEKYENKADRFVSSENNTDEQEMTYEEAKEIILHGTGKWGMESLRLNQQAIDVALRTEANWIKDHVKPACALINPTEIKPAVALLNAPEPKPAINTFA